MSKLVLVGELNPYGMDPRFALYHLPRHASGNRLREHLGLSDITYEALHKTNLCYGKWSMKNAREAAQHVFTAYDQIVLLGAKVREAFNGPEFFSACSIWPLINSTRSVSLITLPHPSGLNRMWNEPGARERARSALRVFAPGTPWGEVGR